MGIYVKFVTTELISHFQATTELILIACEKPGRLQNLHANPASYMNFDIFW